MDRTLPDAAGHQRKQTGARDSTPRVVVVRARRLRSRRGARPPPAGRGAEGWGAAGGGGGAGADVVVGDLVDDLARAVEHGDGVAVVCSEIGVLPGGGDSDRGCVFERHTIGPAFVHRRLTRNNLVYVVDVVGMDLLDGTRLALECKGSERWLRWEPLR